MEKFKFEKKQDKKEFEKIPKSEQEIAKEIFNEESEDYKKKLSPLSPKKVLPEKAAEIEESRVLSDAELLKGGAKYVPDKHSADYKRLLDVTENQVKKAQILMEIDICRKKVNERMIGRFKKEEKEKEEYEVASEYFQSLLEKAGFEIRDGKIYDPKNRKYRTMSAFTIYDYKNRKYRPMSAFTGKKVQKKIPEEIPVSDLTLTLLDGTKVRGEYAFYGWKIKLDNSGKEDEDKGLLFSSEKAKGWKTKNNGLGYKIWSGDFPLNEIVKIEK